ncbi:o-succinylbenzoate synthase [Actinoplanes cyaneus]|uniref:o-succinylbenzoate synthase n=1 Tax=Actinoplanes cyaneus TaxID=52696 RepID=A0A919IKB7_9ACTN|nr:o-succinylbenzoate synthase [Actinoplanes cyaneus]MCW2139599.1 O-succinylbenzoate synthase [Actinoplanes cyaneus]GID66131.1 o-succinylbenzoate synthase [Actinoplanes cyaneus]
MRIARIRLHWVRLPLVTPFRTSVYTEFDREALLVSVHTTDGVVGWGECVAMAEPVYSPEYLEGCVRVLRERLIPLVERLVEVTAENARAAFTAVDGNPNAKAVLEMAILDAQLRRKGMSLAGYLGATRTSVPAGVSLGIMTRDELREAADHFWNREHYRRIKLKIKPGWDEEPVRLVREFLGPHAALQVDANGAYTLDDAGHLARLDDCDLVMIEQPLDADDVDGHALLARRLKTRICLDEPIVSAATAAHAIDAGAAAIINIKPGRVGGYLEARDIHDACGARGVPVWVGGMLETGIGRAANVALAAMEHFTLVGDLSGSERFYKQDITPPIVVRDGHIAVPAGPGIGIEPDEAALGEATERTEWIDLAAGVVTGRAR